MNKRISWFASLGLFAAAVLLLATMPAAAAEGWCCLDGAVFAATPEQCKEKGGKLLL